MNFVFAEHSRGARSSRRSSSHAAVTTTTRALPPALAAQMRWGAAGPARPPGWSTMTCHGAMTSGSMFRDTIRAIDGGECGGSGCSGSMAVKERVDAYMQFAKGLGIANPGMPTDLDC